MPEPAVRLPPLPCLNLALQGGGSHGALAWGVLDALLEDGQWQIDGVSGTSAGAINAVAMAHGFAHAEQENNDPRDAHPPLGGVGALSSLVWGSPL